MIKEVKEADYRYKIGFRNDVGAWKRGDKEEEIWRLIRKQIKQGQSSQCYSGNAPLGKRKAKVLV